MEIDGGEDGGAKGFDRTEEGEQEAVRERSRVSDEG